MALGGSPITRNMNMYTDGLLHEYQQNGSLLSNLVTVEHVEGDKTFFDKIGAAAAPIEITSVLQPTQYGSMTFERRQLYYKRLADRQYLDPLNVHRMVNTPINDYMIAQAVAMGRAVDNVIVNAIMGNANVEIDGVVTPTALPSGQKVADTFIGFSDLTAGSHMLHSGMLLEGKRILNGKFALSRNQDIFVVLNSLQATALLAELKKSGISRMDFLQRAPLSIPGLEMALDGYLGLRFVVYEFIPQVASKDTIIMLTKDAVKMGIREPLNARIIEDPATHGLVTSVGAFMSVGAVRIFDEAVIQINAAVS